MKVKCFSHNSNLLGVLNFHYCLCTIFSFSFSISTLAKITGFDSHNDKTHLLKGKKKKKTIKKKNILLKSTLSKSIADILDTRRYIHL